MHAWETRTLKHIKVGIWKKRENQKGGKCRRLVDSPVARSLGARGSAGQEREERWRKQAFSSGQEEQRAVGGGWGRGGGVAGAGDSEAPAGRVKSVWERAVSELAGTWQSTGSCYAAPHCWLAGVFFRQKWSIKSLALAWIPKTCLLLPLESDPGAYHP